MGEMWGPIFELKYEIFMILFSLYSKKAIYSKMKEIKIIV